MLLSEVFLGLGEENFQGLLRSISMGKLRSFQLFDRFKTRTHLPKLNSESLRKAAPRLWTRMSEKDEEYATDIAQAALVSNLGMIEEVLNHLGVPHEDGFFAKETDVATYLKDGWQQRAFEEFRTKHPPAALVFYLNHLAWETVKSEQIFTPAA